MKSDIRSRFSQVLKRPDIYLANHSLGRPLDQTAQDVAEGLNLWQTLMDDAWDPWLAEMNRWRANVAKLISAESPDRIVPKSSAGQGLRAVLNAFPPQRPVDVITTRGEFDSIDFILKAYAHSGRANVHWVESTGAEGPVPLFDVDAILNCPAFGGEPGLIVVSLVFFRTSQILQDAQRLILEAHSRGWLVLLDLYHAVGVLPVDFASLGADFGIGGSYKYLRGGPGSCWLALGNRISAPGFQTLDTGWFAKKDTFGYERSDVPAFADGGDAWLESTPLVLSPYQARAGLDFTLEIGVENLREFSLEQQANMRRIFAERGVEMFEPSDPARFGAYSLMVRSDASEFSKALKGLGVNTDSRGQFVRFGPDLLNTTEEFDRAAGLIKGSSYRA